MLSTMMARLKPSKLLRLLGKNYPKDFHELISRAQKYANTEALTSSRHDEISKFGEKRKKSPEQQQHLTDNKRNKNDVGGGTKSPIVPRGCFQ